MATTAGDLINLALKDAGIVGVGQTALAEDANDALTRLNQDLLDQWNRKRWLIWHLVEYYVASTGANSYTVGPAGDIVIASRPDRLEDAFLRQPQSGGVNPIDYPLEILQAREDYDRIALKKLQSFPEFIFYDSAWDTGVIYPWPVPQPSIYEVHIIVKETLTEFTSLATTINMPPEYFSALRSNLAVILRDAYDLPPKPVLIQRAKVALNTIRGANAQIGRLAMPPGLMKAGIYDFFSDRMRGN